MSERHDDPIARTIRRAADGVAPITLAEVTARDRIDLDGVPLDGEPVTDALVRKHEGGTTGGPEMVIDLERMQEAGAATASPPRRRERRRWPLAAAAALVAVVAAVGWAAADGDDRVELAPADDPPVVEDPGADALQRATMLVDGFLGDYNDGDPFAVDESSAVLRAKLIDPTYLVADDHWTRTGPCRLDGGDGVVCPILRRDDFHGAAGLSIEEDYVFRFDSEGRLVDLALLEADPWADHLAFRADFRAWVGEQHPELGMRWFPPAGSYSDELAQMPTADSMPQALELLEEFLAQSDRWG